MSRDVRKPVIPLAVEEDDQFIALRSDGTHAAPARITFSREDVGRMKAGYVCAKCFETQDEAFPEKCRMKWCQFPIRERQLEFLAKAYQGDVRLGPETSLEDEIAALDYLEEKARREQSVSKPQILMPGRDF